MRVNELKGAVARDDYVVDPEAVAEALLRRGRHALAAALIAPGAFSGGRSRAGGARPTGRASARRPTGR
jgi:Anti-sigma-28 factor, FlgM